MTTNQDIPLRRAAVIALVAFAVFPSFVPTVSCETTGDAVDVIPTATNTMW